MGLQRTFGISQPASAVKIHSQAHIPTHQDVTCCHGDSMCVGFGNMIQIQVDNFALMSLPILVMFVYN